MSGLFGRPPFPPFVPHVSARGTIAAGSRQSPTGASVLTGEPAPEIPEDRRKYVAWAAIARHPRDEVAFDRFGNELHWSEYGMQTEHGWHVDRYPTAGMHGGRYTRGNMQARHWRTNVTLGAILARYGAK